MSESVILMSGGIRSAVAAARVADEHELFLVHADFGQASFQAEARAIQKLIPTLPNARYVALPLLHFVELEHVLGLTARGADSGPHSPAALRGFIPVLYSLGVQCAMRLGATQVITGLNEDGPGAHLGLPGSGMPHDTRRAFLHSFNAACELLSPNGRAIRIEAPLMGLKTSEVIKLAEHLGLPLESTWSCVADSNKPCRRCEPCRARAAAFEQLLTPDPSLQRRRNATAHISG